MKYTIMGFSQEKILEHDLDLTDVLILRWFIDFKNTDSMVTEIRRKQVYYWIKYDDLMKDIPIIKISNKDVLRRRLKKLVDKKILKHFTKKAKGTYSFYSLGKKYLELISSYRTDIQENTRLKNRRGYDSKIGGGTTFESEGYDSKVGTKHPSTKHSSNKKYSSTKQQQQKNDSREEKNTEKEYPQSNNNIKINDLEQIESIQQKIENEIGQISKKVITKLINKHGNKKVNYYIDNFYKFTGNINNPTGFFVKALENNYAIPKAKKAKYINKCDQSYNFDQREYTDEEFEELYENYEP